VERRQLEFFVAVAEAGSFTRAAARLHVAQPSLSYAVRTLEQELGHPLFERHGRGARLTDSGEALLGPARRTLRSFALAAGAVRATGEEGVGRLSIVASTPWVVEPLVGLVSEFRRVHPRVELVISDPASRREVLERVRAGDVDLGLVDGVVPDAPVASRRLAEHELVAVLPPGPPRRPSTVRMAELVGQGLIGTPPGTPLRALVDARLEEAGLPTRLAVETAHVASLVPLVLAGAGVVMLPEGMAGEAAAKGARVVPLEPASRTPVHLVWRADRLSVPAEQFLGVVRATEGLT